MDMQGKIQKVSLYVFTGYFLFVLVSAFLSVPSIVTDAVNILVIMELYGSRIITHYMSSHKVSFLLVGLFLLYMGWYGYQICFGAAGWKGNQVITLLLAYAYVIVAEKMTNGKVSRRLIFLSCFFVGMEVCKLVADGTAFQVVMTLAQAAVILALVDPMMKKAAKKGADRRAKEGLETEDIPLIRRILFGRTGTLRLDMVTGTRIRGKNENVGNHSHSSRKDRP